MGVIAESKIEREIISYTDAEGRFLIDIVESAGHVPQVIVKRANLLAASQVSFLASPERLLKIAEALSDYARGRCGVEPEPVDKPEMCDRRLVVSTDDPEGFGARLFEGKKAEPSIQCALEIGHDGPHVFPGYPPIEQSPMDADLASTWQLCGLPLYDSKTGHAIGFCGHERGHSFAREAHVVER